MEAFMIDPGVFCSKCGSAYPNEGVPFRCPICGGLYDYKGAFHFDRTKVDRTQPGIWRYRHTFGLPPDFEPISLGEGNTPLIWAKILGRQIAFKCEFLNPSGSFKDRGSAVISTWLKGRGVVEAVEDSSGNAGASFAAYAIVSATPKTKCSSGRAGLSMRQCTDFCKGRQTERYGSG